MIRSFQIGGLTLHTFGILVGLGFLAGLWLAGKRCRAVGLSPEVPYDLAFPWILISALVGARLLYVVSYWQRDFAGQSWIEPFAIWRGGLVFYGGLGLAIVVGIWRIRRLRLPLWKVSDCLVPGLALGHVFGRIGCLLNGCCYGRVCDLPWALRYPHEFTADHLPVFPLDPVHPTQAYEALLDLTLAGALTWLHGRRRFEGQVSAAYLMGYAGIRSFVEFFRGDYPIISHPLSGIFTPGQFASAFVFAAGFALYLFRRHDRLPKSGSSAR